MSVTVDSIAAPQAPLQTVIPSYLYEQYSDDVNLQAFVAAYNTIAQSYLAWFNSTPLGLYSSPNISGELLDWLAQGVYGIQRPVFSSLTRHFFAGLNAFPLNTGAVNGNLLVQSGTATIATDDYYKRVLTWWFYVGDGRYFNTTLLRLKIARFIYGINGADVTLSQAQTIKIQPQNVRAPNAAPVLSSVSGGSLASAKYGVQETYVSAIGETTAGPAASLTVASSYRLFAASPGVVNGAQFYNVYVGILSANPGKFKAGVNALPVNAMVVNGSNKRAASPPTKQNATPIPIGTNWTEPTTGLVAGAALPVTNTSNTPGNFIITLPAGTPSEYFQQAFDQGLLAFPFQLSATIMVV